MIKVEVKVMLHNEERRLIIQALNGHIPVKEIAECFSVNTSTIYRLRKQMEMTGSVETRTSLRGRKPVLSNDDIVCRFVKHFVQRKKQGKQQAFL